MAKEVVILNLTSGDGLTACVGQRTLLHRPGTVVVGLGMPWVPGEGGLRGEGEWTEETSCKPLSNRHHCQKNL